MPGKALKRAGGRVSGCGIGTRAVLQILLCVANALAKMNWILPGRKYKGQ